MTTMNWTKNPPIRSPRVRDIVGAAWFYEGEGHCRFHNGLYAGISQKDPNRLLILRDLFGGSVQRKEWRGRFIHVWHMFGGRAAGFLMTIYTELSPRRQEQIRRALQGWLRKGGKR